MWKKKRNRLITIQWKKVHVARYRVHFYFDDGFCAVAVLPMVEVNWTGRMFFFFLFLSTLLLLLFSANFGAVFFSAGGNHCWTNVGGGTNEIAHWIHAIAHALMRWTITISLQCERNEWYWYLDLLWCGLNFGYNPCRLPAFIAGPTGARNSLESCWIGRWYVFDETDDQIDSPNFT